MGPKDPRGEELAAILSRRAPHFEALFRRHGLSPDQAYSVLDRAVLEVQLRCYRTGEMEGRLMRSVERGCATVLDERRRQAPEALGPATEPTESRGSGDREPAVAEHKGEP
jgi:hypothetical protein